MAESNGDELEEECAEAGAGRKRRPELELSSSTKLKAALVEGGDDQKQRLSPPETHAEQAVPVSGDRHNPMSKTSQVANDNSTADFCGPSRYKDTPIFIEACAGCGILSSVVQQRGFQFIPIDCPRNRHTPKCRVVVLDLTTPYADELLKRIVRDYNVAGVHIALPCGTCSKARGIPMPDGSAGPPPLRDAQNLHGFAKLSSANQAKVTAANALYAWADQFIQFLHSMGFAWTVENPTNSWLWEMPEMSFALAHGHFVTLHSCADGGERKKNTAFLCSESEFQALEKFCDASHPHKGWGYDFQTGEFNTAKEAEYPRALCVQYANILERYTFGSIGMHTAETGADKAKPNQQPRGRAVPQIISEFASVRSLTSTTAPPINSKRLLTELWMGVPAGAKLLRSEAKGGSLCLCFWPLQEHGTVFDVAKQLWHPFDELRNLPGCLVRCIFNCLKDGPVEMTKKRIKVMQQWVQWEKELRPAEQVLHRGLHDKVAQVLVGKNLLLLEKLANAIDWPDKSLHQELREGFRLTGYAPPSGVFKVEVRPATFDKEKLMQHAKFLKPLLLGKVESPYHADEHAEEL